MKEKNNEIEKNNQIIEARAEQLAKRIEALVVEARRKIASTVNVAMVYTYFEVGRYIIEDEQGGKTRAEYGKGILKGVSARLTASLGKGWSVDTLEKTRRFFLTFSKSATPQRFLAEGENSATVQRKFVVEHILGREALKHGPSQTLVSHLLIGFRIQPLLAFLEE